MTVDRSSSTSALAALRAVLLALSESMGECREALPYAPIIPWGRKARAQRAAGVADELRTRNSDPPGG